MFAIKLAPLMMMTALILPRPNAWANPAGKESVLDIQQGDEIGEASQLLKAKKWAEAAILLRSSLRKSWSTPVAIDLARALVFSGRREEALTVLGQALGHERSTQSRRSLIQKSRVLSRVFLTNATFQIHQDGVNLMMARKYRAAREKFEKVLEQDTANVESLIRLGQCLVLEGDYDSASERLRLARRLNPYESEVQLWLGRALYQRGELGEALEELKAAYQDQPTSEVASIWLAETWVALGNRDQALRLLHDNVTVRPDNVGAIVALARLRLNATSPHDSHAAWESRKELQLALSRLSGYLAATSSSALPMPGTPASAITTGDSDAVSVLPAAPSSNELALDQRNSENELRHEIQRLMSEADSRIERGQQPSS
jgi:tetratricopeptide (TPR) repeat protein